MPVRMIDGDALWRSDKLAKIQPPAWRAEYANLLPLALADGTFECNPRRVWSDVYSYNRPDMSERRVSRLLDELERVGLLSRKTDSEGKTWGFWVGIEKRLPSEAHRERYRNGNSSIFNKSDEKAPDVIPPGLDRIGKVRIAPVEIDEPDTETLTVEQREKLNFPEGLNWKKTFSRVADLWREAGRGKVKPLGIRRNQWERMVEKYGSAHVLAAVDLWIKELDPNFEVFYMITQFLKDAEQYLSAIRISFVKPKENTLDIDPAALEANIVREQTKIVQTIEAHKEEKKKGEEIFDRAMEAM